MIRNKDLFNDPKSTAANYGLPEEACLNEIKTLAKPMAERQHKWSLLRQEIRMEREARKMKEDLIRFKQR